MGILWRERGVSESITIRPEGEIESVWPDARRVARALLKIYLRIMCNWIIFLLSFSHLWPRGKKNEPTLRPLLAFLFFYSFFFFLFLSVACKHPMTRIDIVSWKRGGCPRVGLQRSRIAKRGNASPSAVVTRTMLSGCLLTSRRIRSICSSASWTESRCWEEQGT